MEKRSGLAEDYDMGKRRSEWVGIKQAGKNRAKGFPLWTIGILLGTVCLVIGILEGQLVDLYRKAVMICLECIGIG